MDKTGKHESIVNTSYGTIQRPSYEREIVLHIKELEIDQSVILNRETWGGQEKSFSRMNLHLTGLIQ